MRESKIGKYWVHYGYLRGISIGFKIDKYGWDLDLFKFFIGMSTT